ncbi:MAG: helix-turn-helix domain-containing protein [Dethiobacteria bacterium]
MSKKEYSKKEAAELLGVTPSAIQRRIERKTIEARKDKQGHWLVCLTDEEIEKSGAQRSKQKAAKTVTKTGPQAAPAKVAPPAEASREKKDACFMNGNIGEALISGNLISQAVDFTLELKDKAEELTKDLAERGGLHLEEANKLVESVMEKVEAQKNVYLIKLMEGIEAVRSRIVTRQDVERLEKKIEILDKKIQALKEKS